MKNLPSILFGVLIPSSGQNMEEHVHMLRRQPCFTGFFIERIRTSGWVQIDQTASFYCLDSFSCVCVCFGW